MNTTYEEATENAAGAARAPGVVRAAAFAGAELIALCAVWPASSRPYIGGSTDNSLWDLAMGYNGLARIFGGSGSGGGMGGNGNTAFGGATGILRMFGASFGADVAERNSVNR